MIHFYIWQTFFVLVVLLVLNEDYCEGHGRLIEPPSRASAWRYGFQTPPDYNDHELYCGGFTRQWKKNEGKCGECGDAWDMPTPRPHENGGQWGQGVIVRSYTPKSEILIRVELTASHMGYFEFRLCPTPNAKQACFDEYILPIMSGAPSQPSLNDLSTRFYPRNGSRIYEMKSFLPDLECEQCVLQWRYVAGNNWGMCADGNGAVGCGPQEEFRSCSDISISNDAHTPIRPLRPIFRTTAVPKTTIATTELPHKSDKDAYIEWVVLAFVIVLIFCCFALWYYYRLNDSLVNEWLEKISNRFCKKHQDKSLKPTSKKISNLTKIDLTIKANDTAKNNYILNTNPVPPPRTKRLSRVNEINPNQSSIA